ncbi:MAG TPA: PRC-barrel domain-containing protein [Methanobacterium sp.]|nr:PRC-barrel domain-containing protein [Methanobacterium sp.]
MQVSEFLGKKVLDKNAVEIGKVSDVDLMPKEGIINSITVSTGDMWLRNKNFEIKSSDIDQIGDYILLNLVGSSIEEIIEEEKEPESETPKKRLTLNKD